MFDAEMRASSKVPEVVCEAAIAIGVDETEVVRPFALIVTKIVSEAEPVVVAVATVANVKASVPPSIVPVTSPVIV